MPNLINSFHLSIIYLIIASHSIPLPAIHIYKIVPDVVIPISPVQCGIFMNYSMYIVLV